MRVSPLFRTPSRFGPPSKNDISPTPVKIPADVDNFSSLQAPASKPLPGKPFAFCAADPFAPPNFAPFRRTECLLQRTATLSGPKKAGAAPPHSAFGLAFAGSSRSFLWLPPRVKGLPRFLPLVGRRSLCPRTSPAPAGQKVLPGRSALPDREQRRKSFRYGDFRFPKRAVVL